MIVHKMRLLCMKKCVRDFVTLFITLIFFVSNLDETTRSVYKENVRLNAALDFHLKEGQELKKVCLLLYA